ncbi:tyrosine-type recombinase/integrase [Leucobacter musarum]|uniref:tyrosine-type recombinase/integrase n=1 Tax=Leucobacter musarum TaxID=1930747 RepID=UPI0006A78317|nr:tyrosine-type recombinase/integrase [Leucobacter musarum]
MTLPDDAKLLQEYRLHLLRQGRSPGTLEQRLGDVRRLLEAIGPADSVSRQSLESYIDERTEHWSAAYRKKVYASYRIYFYWARKRQFIQNNPAKHLAVVRVPRYLPRPAPEDVVIEAFDGAPLIESAMLSLAAAQGLRRAEIASAHPMNRDGDLLRVTGKGSKERVVPLDALTLSLLEQLEAMQGRQEFYFRGRFGGHLHPATVYKWLKRYLGDDWSTHNLRHRAASLGLRVTGDLRGVQELLGHASLATTQVYTLVDTHQLAAIVEATSLQRKVIEYRLNKVLLKSPTQGVQAEDVLAAMSVLAMHLRDIDGDATLAA